MEGVVGGEGEEAPKAYPKGVENLQGSLDPHLGEGSRSEESLSLLMHSPLTLGLLACGRTKERILEPAQCSM